ncbi:MAG: hypothetical protein NZ108_06970, partial [Bacteroidia bacterium]|nr:hypothetical protein [Bacteroidia bacterium]
MLPLSWRFVPTTETCLSEIKKLPLSGYHWICWADVPETMNWSEWIQQFAGNRWIIRGLPEELLPQVEKIKATAIPQGIEARLNLKKSHFAKKSIRELVRRGRKYGYVHEITSQTDTQNWFQTLYSQTRYHGRPPLSGLFRTTLQPGMRIFSFQTDFNWFASMILIESQPGFYHTELIFRKK